MHITTHYKRLGVRRLKIAVAAIVISLFFMPNFTKVERGEDNYFTVFVNGQQVGILGSEDAAKECFLQARRNVNSLSDKLTFLEAELTYDGQNITWGKIDSKDTVISNIEEIMKNNITRNLVKAYELKVNDYTVVLASLDEIEGVLQAAIDNYDEDNNYQVNLLLDSERELPVLIPVLNTKEEIKADEEAKESAIFMGGFDADMITFFNEIEPDVELELEDYETGMVSMGYKDKIEVTEVYVDESQLDDVTEAIGVLTANELKNEVYVVQSGDTLSGIALKMNTPMDDIIARNDFLEDTSSLIRPNDEIIIAVDKPKLTVLRKEVLYYEENYSAEVEVIKNDDWYTTESVVHVQPSDGHRRVVAEVTFENDAKADTSIIEQVVDLEAVAKVVERGTKIPPTYIKPIAGGRLTSNFGPRKRPTKGASSNHKGVDWATPVGTPVYASCGGTVARAGWLSGYGYCVYINHPDGRQTRYAHCSKVLVSAGQSVSQGQRIALSGNTGVSTGPHLHFEILIGGSQVNPLKYL